MKEVRKSFWDFVVVSGSSVLAIPLMLISEIIQTRFLGVENYGKVALFYSSINLVFIISVSWLRLSVVRHGKEEYSSQGNIRETAAGYFSISLICLLFASVIFYRFKRPLLTFLEVKHSFAFPMILTGVITLTLKTFVLEALKALRLIKIQITLEKLCVKLLIAFAALFPVLFGLGWISVNYMIGAFIVSDLLVFLIGAFFIKARYVFPLKFNKQHIRLIFLFSFPLFFSAWSSYIVSYVDTYVIKYYLSMKEVGIYTASYKIFSTIKSFISVGVTSITVPLIIAFKTEKRLSSMRRFFVRFVPQAVFLGFIGVSLIIAFSDPLFLMIYGPNFKQSILPFKILTGSLVFNFIASFILGYFYAYDKTTLLTGLGIFWGVFNVLGDLLLTRLWGVTGPAFASFLIFSLGPIILYIIFLRLFRIRTLLPLIYGGISIVIMLVNIAEIQYIFKVVITLALLLGSIIISKKFELFRKEDIEMLSDVNLPQKFRNIVERLILLMCKH